MEAIHAATFRNDLEEVRRLIEDGPQLVDSLYDGRTPLFLACLMCRVQAAALLLDHGANINYQEPSDGRTPLRIACGLGHLPVVELLLERGANPATCSSNGRTPLIEASTRGHVDVVRCLLNHPHYKAVSTTTTTTASAVHADLNKALWHACRKGHVEIVRMLLIETGADPFPRDRCCSAMDMAKHKGHQECVKLIEEWERSYVLTKARRLYDAYYHHHHHIANHPNPPQDDDHDGRTKMRVRVEGTARAAVPTYVKGRVEKGQELAKVEVVVRGREEKVSVGGVLEHVVCGGLKGELFVELMEMMGRVGVRAED